MNNAVTIYSWGGVKTIKSFSPFCMKAIYATQLKGVKPSIVYVTMKMPSWMKKGTLPAAIINDAQVEDSTSILAKLDASFPESQPFYPLDEGLLAETKLFEDWVDEYFSNFGVVYRWKVDEFYERFAHEAFGKMPWLLRKLVLPRIRKETISAFEFRTIGAASDSERLALFHQALKIVAHRLGDKPYLISNHLTAADLALYCCMEQIYYVSKIDPLMNAIHQYPTVVNWLNQMNNKLAKQA